MRFSPFLVVFHFDLAKLDTAGAMEVFSAHMLGSWECGLDEARNRGGEVGANPDGLVGEVAEVDGV
jgi:hypothetical protein